jgi:hypothetical protein
VLADEKLTAFRNGEADCVHLLKDGSRTRVEIAAELQAQITGKIEHHVKQMVALYGENKVLESVGPALLKPPNTRCLHPRYQNLCCQTKEAFHSPNPGGKNLRC